MFSCPVSFNYGTHTDPDRGDLGDAPPPLDAGDINDLDATDLRDLDPRSVGDFTEEHVANLDHASITTDAVAGLLPDGWSLVTATGDLTAPPASKV